MSLSAVAANSKLEQETRTRTEGYRIHLTFENFCRIPPVLWPRLHDDLNTYIVQREANGILVFYWYHRQFIAVAKKRYLRDATHNEYIHSLLADYFLGKICTMCLKTVSEHYLRIACN